MAVDPNPAEGRALVREGARAPVPQESTRRSLVRREGGALELARASGPVLSSVATRARNMGPVWLSFAAMVVLPTLLAAIYYAFIAADQFVTESRFGVRSADMYRVDSGGGASMALGAGGVLAAGIDSHVIVQFVQSPEVVSSIQKKIDLVSMFTRPEVDVLSRLSSNATIEDLTLYWRSRVDAFFDITTGTVSVKVRAFRAEDSLLIAQEVLRLSEALVNDISTRARADALRIAEGEVAGAENRLKAAREALLAVRNEEGILDPKVESQAQLGIITTLRSQLVRARSELTDMLNYLDPNSVQIRTTRNRIRSLEEQINAAEAQRTAGAPDGRGETMSKSMSRFERLESERMFAERHYTMVLEEMQKARVNAARQQVYLATFVRPILPARSLYPKRFQNTLLVFFGLLFAWVLSLVMIRSVSEHV